jgi:NAD(P)H dehydrogenase (quinone)
MGNEPALMVSGAAGQLGRRTIAELLRLKPGRILAATRDPAKLEDLKRQGVEVRRGDFDDPASLAGAFAGVERLLLISTDALDRPGRRLEQHLRALEGARKAGVKRIVYTSLVRPDPDSPIGFARDHRETEAAIAKSGLAYTILRNTFYADNLLGSLPNAVASGTLYGAGNDGMMNFVTREDCARAAAAALASADVSGRTLDITGPLLFTYPDLAAIAARISGKPVAYVNLDPASLRQGMLRAGLPEVLADLYVSFDVAIARGFFAAKSGAVRELCGQDPQSLAEFLGSRKELLLGRKS